MLYSHLAAQAMIWRRWGSGRRAQAARCFRQVVLLAAASSKCLASYSLRCSAMLKVRRQASSGKMLVTWRL